MRAFVMGAVNDERTKILLYTGANISAISGSFARKLKRKNLLGTDTQIYVQGIGKVKMLTASIVTVKITLGWKVLYEFEV